MQDYSHLFPQSIPKMSFLWPAAAALAQWNPIPRKYRLGRSRRKQKPRLSVSAPPSRFSSTPLAGTGKIQSHGVAALQRSFNPADGLRALRRHRWNMYDLQHVITIAFVLFSFLIAPIPIIADIGIVLGYSLLVLMPATRQFFLPSLPIWTYLFYFFSSR